jgi:hypothetical protein
MPFSPAREREQKSARTRGAAHGEGSDTFAMQNSYTTSSPLEIAIIHYPAPPPCYLHKFPALEHPRDDRLVHNVPYPTARRFISRVGCVSTRSWTIDGRRARQERKGTERVHDGVPSDSIPSPFPAMHWSTFEYKSTKIQVAILCGSITHNRGAT